MSMLHVLAGLLALLAGAGLLLALFTAWTAHKVEAALGPNGTLLDLAEGWLHFVDKGMGPPILLIHGIAGNLRHFTYGVVDRLAATHRVIAVDRPGCGYSTRKAGAPVSLQAQADAISQLLDQLGVGKATVVGHSLGGAVALALAQRHPEHVAALALIAPLTALPEKASPAFKALAVSQVWLRHLIAWTLASPATMVNSKSVLQLVFGPEAAPRDFATRGGGLLALRPSHFVAASSDLNTVPGSMPEIEAGYAAMRIPVHVLYGRGDRILSPRANGEALPGRLPGSRLTLVEGGHMLPITQPQATADFIAAVARNAA